ncbi:MAG: SDR family oxidoreductase [Solirubrobacteraceae bacterium MAG38_C4-C5]|nr:SDR family oxidoreductase [Candidatus Siliceabacter maunaloa]
MASLVTGATGFIGKHLVERLLARDGDVHVLVRASSRPKLDALVQRWGHAERVKAVVGDLGLPRLGAGDADLEALRGVDHVFHLAAVYDMAADEERNRVANVGGTRNAVELANALVAGRFHHVSSVAAAGMYRGTFTEAMFDEGQPLEHPYHATKFASEKIVREETAVPWRVYRPAVVVGDSRTGEMDKIDGPYYFFRAIRAASRLPSWIPLVGPELGDTNIVPVDFVADAIDHLAHADGFDGQAFHLCSPEPLPSVEVLNAFARAAGAPRLAARMGGRPAAWAVTRGTTAATRAPLIGGPLRRLLAAWGIPAEIIAYLGFTARFDTAATRRALGGSGVAVPPLEGYADRLWDYWERNLR